MIEFFINRFYENFSFSFLSKTNIVNETITIKIFDDICSYECKYTFKTTEPEIIHVNLQNIIINQKNFTKCLYNYLVSCDDKNIYYGSFNVINQNSDINVEFGFVSCNDNVQNNDWNFYHKKSVSNEIWYEITKKKYDILIHNGDNIYNDSTYDEFVKKKNKELVRKRMRELFVDTYSDKYQGQAMRHSWNFHLIDDHDITDCFGTPGTEKVVSNSEFHEFYQIAKKELDKYLVINNNKNNIDYTRSFHVNNKYELLFLDTRHSLYFDRQSYSDEIINFCKEHVKLKKVNLLILPRPLFHLSKFSCSLIDSFVPDARDSTWHAKQCNQSKKFYQLLFNLSDTTKIFVISGDIHETFIQTHKHLNKSFQELVTSGVTRETQNYSPFYVKVGLNLLYFIDYFCNKGNKLNEKPYISSRRNYSNKNNFGELVNDILNNYHFT
jgi:hypothetical protein